MDSAVFCRDFRYSERIHSFSVSFEVLFIFVRLHKLDTLISRIGILLRSLRYIRLGEILDRFALLHRLAQHSDLLVHL